MNTVQERLTVEVERWAALGHPALLQRFILATGQAFAAQPLLAKTKPGRQRECFANAIRLAKRYPLRYRYVEGFGITCRVPFPVHHAWVVDESDRVVDRTWRDPESCTYFGRVFTLDEWERETDRTHTMSALDGCGLNHAFMFATVPGLRVQMHAQIAAAQKKTPALVGVPGLERLARPSADQTTDHDASVDQGRKDHDQ